MQIRIQLLVKVMRICIQPSTAPFGSLHASIWKPSRLHGSILNYTDPELWVWRGSESAFNADPNPAFYSDADPACCNDADPDRNTDFEDSDMPTNFCFSRSWATVSQSNHPPHFDRCPLLIPESNPRRIPLELLVIWVGMTAVVSQLAHRHGIATPA
jgi:hypothetical protein